MATKTPRWALHLAIILLVVLGFAWVVFWAWNMWVGCVDERCYQECVEAGFLYGSSWDEGCLCSNRQ